MFSQNIRESIDYCDQSKMPPYSNGFFHDKVEIINENDSVHSTVSQKKTKTTILIRRNFVFLLDIYKNKVKELCVRSRK